MCEYALYDESDGVATVTMNRPDRLNTMTDTFLEAMLKSLETAAESVTAKAVVLRGEGKAFCAGGDLREGIGGGVGGDGSITTAAGNLRRYMRTAQLLREMPKPTIAAVHGACAGAGLSLACAADLRIASRSAVFATAFLTVGLSGDFGGTWLLPRIVGEGRARQAYLLSERIDAVTALEWGLVGELVDGDETLPVRATEIARRLAAGPAQAARAVKANLNDSPGVSFAEALEREAVRHIACSRTDDAAEATRAFLAKRTPVFGQPS